MPVRRRVPCSRRQSAGPALCGLLRPLHRRRRSRTDGARVDAFAVQRVRARRDRLPARDVGRAHLPARSRHRSRSARRAALARPRGKTPCAARRTARGGRIRGPLQGWRTCLPAPRDEPFRARRARFLALCRRRSKRPLTNSCHVRRRVIPALHNPILSG
ncbi:putative Transcriptional regulator, AcrR family [Burkholderia sp. IT-111MI5]